MENNNEDIFYQFIKKYQNRQVHEALRLIIPQPDIHYDSLSSENLYFKHLVNFADACVFKGNYEAAITATVVESVIESFPLSVEFNPFFGTIKFESGLLSAFDRVDPDLFPSVDKYRDYFLNLMPSSFSVLIDRRTKIMQRWKQLSELKPRLTKALGGKLALKRLPFHQFTYDLPVNSLLQAPEGTIPVIILQPLENVDYDSILKPYRGRPTIYVFDTLTMYFQHLQFESIHCALIDPSAVIYILDRYPNDQFAIQNIEGIRDKTLFPIVMVQRKAFSEIETLFLEALTQYFQQEKPLFEQDTPLAQWLYLLSKRFLFRIEAEKLGASRALALKTEQDSQEWHDPHKGKPLQGADLGPLPHNHLLEMYLSVNQKRQIRRYGHKKIKLAHVVPQIVDLRHAPTHLLTRLVTHHNRDLYDVAVLSTERMMLQPFDYPIPSRISQPSVIRGAETIKMFESMGVPTITIKPITYDISALTIANMLEQFEADIAVFHGPDVVNNLCGVLTNTSKRVMYEHGTLPSYPCYDLAILSIEEMLHSHRDELLLIGMESRFLPFSADVKINWEIEPFSKKSLGVPEDGFIMTTISNHLNARLSLEMCHAIGEILVRCPKAYYLPIGEIHDEVKMREKFAKYGVNDRIIFLGTKTYPSQYARSMQLYLNEFPFGSCIALLDAMAAGCPIVSMYYKDGPPQAKYGGMYFGIEHVVHSCQKKDYVDLACRLINDPHLYYEWSEHAKQQYEKQQDPINYVRNFEKILEFSLKNHTPMS